MGKKKNKKLLVIDVSTIIYAAKYSKLHLTDATGSQSGMTYAFYNMLFKLVSNVENTHYLLCYDSHLSVRRDSFPGYKDRPKTDTDEETKVFLEQRNYIYESIANMNLPIVVAHGFEADDTMAYFSKMYPTTIASNDGDMLQCLSDTCNIWNIKQEKMITVKDFIADKGIHPRKYGLVKAIGGCKTDTVPGCPGVGDGRAIDYLNGNMNPKSKSYKSIVENKPLIKRNRKLTMLPHKELPELKLPKFRPKLEGFVEMCHEKHFRSFLGRLDHIERVLFT